MNAKKEKDDTKELLGDDKPTEQTPAPASPRALAKPGTQRAPGTESIQGEDTTFPRYRLLQSTSGEVEAKEAEAGVFKNSLTEETYQSIQLIPLSLIKTRVMFNPDDRKGAPVCRSADLVHGSGCDCGCNNICAKCVYSKWQGGIPPECSLVYNYPCLTPTEIGKTAMPTVISFMKASSQAAYKINTFIESQFPLVPFWHHVWEFSSLLKKFKKGSAYIINLKKIRDTDEKEREWCDNVYHHCVAGKAVEVPSEE